MKVGAGGIAPRPAPPVHPSTRGPPPLVSLHPRPPQSNTSVSSVEYLREPDNRRVVTRHHDVEEILLEQYPGCPAGLDGSSRIRNSLGVGRSSQPATCGPGLKTWRTGSIRGSSSMSLSRVPKGRLPS
jgi:hypothetical protein